MFSIVEEASKGDWHYDMVVTYERFLKQKETEEIEEKKESENTKEEEEQEEELNEENLNNSESWEIYIYIFAIFVQEDFLLRIFIG